MSLQAARRLRASDGFTLIELMISIAISSVIIVGVLSLYAQARSTYRVNERIARLQEQGRFALAVIEPDIELAGYYGFTNVADVVQLVRGGNPSAPIATAAQMRQSPEQIGGPIPAPVSSLPPGAHACGVNFAVDVSSPVQGSNDAFALGRGATCKPYQSRAALGADTLTLRRVSTETTAPEANRIQLYADRFTTRTTQMMFADGIAPGPVDANHQIHDFVVRAYYVSRDSVGQDNFPALRVKTLTRSGTTAVFDDDEVMPGIEDLQVQFGLKGTQEGSATRYVNPDFADLPSSQVVAVRIWLRVRSDEAEVAFEDLKTYRYANVVYTPAGAERKYRRVLMSRTVALRNARVS